MDKGKLNLEMLNCVLLVVILILLVVCVVKQCKENFYQKAPAMEETLTTSAGEDVSALYDIGYCITPEFIKDNPLSCVSPKNIKKCNDGEGGRKRFGIGKKEKQKREMWDKHRDCTMNRCPITGISEYSISQLSECKECAKKNKKWIGKPCP